MSGRGGASATPPALVADRYVPIQHLGSGGGGTVWRAKDRSTDTFVALKILDRGALSNPQEELRFAREARLMQKLASPHIVEVLDYGEEEGHAFTVLELVEGETLRDRLRREGRLPVDEAIAIAEQVGRGLSAAHARGVVHRDLKPANVLITLGGRVKLTDFGIAQTVGEPGLTTDGHVLGSGEYMSPEQAQGHLLDGRSDLYSLGVLLFEMIAGRVPFAGIGFADLAAKHIRTPAPSLARFSQEASTPLCDLVGRLLEKSPAERPASADEVVAALRELGADSDVAGEETGSLETVPPSPENVLGATVADTAVEPVEALPEPGTSVLPPPPGAWADDDTESDWGGDDDDTPATGYRPAVPSRADAGIARYAAILGLGLAILAFVGVYVATRDSTTTTKTPVTTAAVSTTLATSAATSSSTSAVAGSENPAGLDPVTVVAAQSFDPNGDGSERQDLAKFAFDGNPATAWTTENYRDQPDLATFKGGVGLEVDLASAVRLGGVRVILTRPGITAGFYVSNETDSPTDLDSWTPASGQKVLTATTTTITFARARRASHLLIWITKLAPDPKGGYIASVAELEPLAAPKK